MVLRVNGKDIVVPERQFSDFGRALLYTTRLGTDEAKGSIFLTVDVIERGEIVRETPSATLCFRFKDGKMLDREVRPLKIPTDHSEETTTDTPQN